MPGEIELRGVALTPKDRALYGQLLNEGRRQTAGLDNEAHQAVMKYIFAKFPDSDEAMRRERLAYFHYHLTDAGKAASGGMEAGMETNMDTLIFKGLVEAQPTTEEGR